MGPSSVTSNLFFYHPAQTRLECPFRMKPLHIYFTRRWSLDGAAQRLLQAQRQAWGSEEPSIPEGIPLLGTPAHCVVGGQPPWIVTKLQHREVRFLPAVVQTMSLRRMDEMMSAFAREFDLALTRLYSERGWTTNIKSHLAEFGDRTPLFDALAVYDSFVKQDGEEREPEDRPYYLWLAEHEILSKLVSNAETADSLATSIVEAIEINFREVLMGLW